MSWSSCTWSISACNAKRKKMFVIITSHIKIKLSVPAIVVPCWIIPSHFQDIMCCVQKLLWPVSVSQRRRLTEMAAAAGALRRAGTRQTGVRGPLTMTLVEVGQTLLTVVALSVVLTVQTNTWGREGQYTEQLIISNSIDWTWESYHYLRYKD